MDRFLLRDISSSCQLLEMFVSLYEVAAGRCLANVLMSVGRLLFSVYLLLSVRTQTKTYEA